MERNPRRWWALAVALLAVLVDMVDNQIVGVALPTVRHDLGAADAALQWISAGYALGFALTLITGGRLGDRYGTKRLFLAGMTVFTAGSVLAGLAPHPGVLVGARVVQGIGAGLMVPQVLSFIHAEFDETERPKAMALFAATFPVGGMAGPLLGGVLTEADLLGTGWRAIFLVNVPIGLLALAGAAATMPTRPGWVRRRMDPVGLALFSCGLFALFFPLVQGRELDWPLWTVGLLVAAVPLLAVFALHQRARARRGGEPLIPSDLLRHRSMTASLAILLCVNTALGVFFVLTLHLQLGLGYSPLRAALTFLPATLGIVAGNTAAMRLAPRFGRPFIAAATAVLLAGLAAVAILVVRLGSGLSAWMLVGPAIGFGLGMGGALNALFGTAMSRIRPDQAGSASGLLNTTIQLGTAAGTAVSGTVFFARLDHGYATATATAVAVSAAVLVLALLLTVALPGRRAGAPSMAEGREPARDVPVRR